MKPRIDETTFGSITVAGKIYGYDVIVRPDGSVKRRKKKLSSAVYGTSHMISLQEARYVRKQAAGAQRLIVGSGPVWQRRTLTQRGRVPEKEEVPRDAGTHAQGD